MKKWELINGQLSELTDYAQKKYINFNRLPKEMVEQFFKKYHEWTYILVEENKICGFAVLQDYGDFYNGFAIYIENESYEENFKNIRMLASILSKRTKRVRWFNEKRMKAINVEI
jgi:hypothetical protein